MELEEQLKERWIKDTLRIRPIFEIGPNGESISDPVNKFVHEHLILKGRREAIEILWQERALLLKKLEEEEKKEEEEK